MSDQDSLNQAQLNVKKAAIPQYDDSHYAVVDLGSNSFHLLITQLVTSPTGNSIKIVNKVKQKVRLAAGLDNQNQLSNEAITLGIDCLKNFSLYLQSIPLNNIIIVATAALRIAKNNQVFFDHANCILPKPIKLLSGEQEAKTIYAGAVYSCTEFNQQAQVKQLVLDIGGASTEMVIGSGCKVQKVVSLNVGCVSTLSEHFSDGLLQLDSFNQCIASARNVINTVKEEFIQLGWQSTVGNSGTMQALVEILNERKQKATITLAFLYEVQQTLIDCKNIENIEIAGLRADRKAVLASGLCILIALFECLNIDNLCLSKGALREGLLCELLPNARIS